MKGTNRAASLVYDYQVRRTLAELGAKMDFEDLSDFDVEYLTICHGEFERLRAEAMKPKKGAAKKGRKR